MQPPLLEAAAGMRWHPGWTNSAEALLNARLQASTEGAAERYAQSLDLLAARPDEGLSLAIKLPFCAAQCLFCERVIHAAQPAAVIDDYVGGLIDELHAIEAHVGLGHDLLQLHLGGGSANELGASQLARLMDALQRGWRLPGDAELSADCDPRRVGWMQLRLLADMGFRRITFGVLDLDRGVQEAVGRVQSIDLVDDVCKLARAAGIDYINLDLMIGLPHQSVPQWEGSLRRLIAIAPDRIRLARFRHRPQWVPVHQSIEADTLPGDNACRQLAEATVRMLCGAGYRWIGGDQFVLDTDELALALEQGTLRRSLISYTATPPTAVLGLGVGAVGEIDGSVFWNETQMPLWREAVRAHRLAATHLQAACAEESQRRAAVQQLMCGLELPVAAARGGLEAAYERLAAHARQGLVRVLDDRIVLTEAGRLELPRLCGELEQPWRATSGQAAPGARAT